MQLLANGKQQFIDQNGAPLAGGFVYHYLPSTSTPATTYQDQAAVTANTNPIQLDSRGQAVIWGSGSYRQVVKDAQSNVIWDQVVASSSSMSDLSASGSVPGAGLVGFDGTQLTQQFLSRINRVVDSVAALRGLSAGTYTRAFATGYYAPHDGGGGHYQYDPADTTTADNGGTVIVAGDGGRWKLQASGSVSVRQFGAKGDYNTTTASGTDDTAAFKAAAATGLNVYVPATATGYLLNDAVTFATISQRIYGDGRFKSNIYVNAAFNMAAAGVFVSAATCIEYVDLAIVFKQPDTAVKTSLTQYPAAISGLNQPGQRIQRCKISGAWTAVDWRDNCGQSSIDDLIYSAFNIGVWLDGAVDSVRLGNLHCWPVDLTANQTLVMTTGGTGTSPTGLIGVNSGRCDDLKVTDGLFYCAVPFYFFSGTRANAGPTFGMLENVDLDGFGGIVIGAGTVSVIGGFQSGATLSQVKLNQSGGVITYTGVNFQIGANFPATAFAAYFNVSGGVCSIVGGSIYKPNDACFSLVTGGQFSLVGANIGHQANAVFSTPLLQVGGSGQMTAVGNTCSPLGTGAQTFFTATADGSHRVSQNTFFGHTINAPTGAGYYGGNFNSVANSEFYNTVLTGDLRVIRLTGTTDGSGNFVAAHGIAQGQYKVLGAQAFYRGTSGESRPMTVTSIDSANISCSGGTASARCRVVLHFTQATDTW